MSPLKLLLVLAVGATAGCASGSYYRMSFKATSPAPLPPVQSVLDALRQDPEVVRVTYRNATGARAPIDRIFRTRYPDTLAIYGAEGGFELDLWSDPGAARVAMEWSTWSATPQYDDHGMTDFMRRVYARLAERVPPLPDPAALKFTVTPYQSAH